MKDTNHKKEEQPTCINCKNFLQPMETGTRCTQCEIQDELDRGSDKQTTPIHKDETH
jgi:hypothetical protein